MVKDRGYDLVGNIAIVKFDRKTKAMEKKKIAKEIMKKHAGISTVLEKTEKFHGRLRTLSTKYVLGEKTKEALYKENGCLFRFNVDSCYFSPRLSSERKEIAEQVRAGEKVLVLFGGVAPFAIVIAKTKKAAKVVSIELGRECNRYAVDNIKRNKVDVEIIGGDVNKVLPKIHEEFDRIVMARPNLEDSFLDVVFPKVKKGGMVHYYGFYTEEEQQKMKELIEEKAKENGKKIRILGIKKAGDIGVRKFRYRVDFKVLN